MNKEIFLKKAERFVKSPTGQWAARGISTMTILGGLSIGMTGCYPEKVIIHDGATPTPAAASGEPAPIINNYNYYTTINQPEKTVTPSPTVTPEAILEKFDLEIEVGDGKKVTAVKINNKISDSTVDTAKNQFVNTIGGGTEAFIAEPGALLVGPDFGSKSSENPNGNNYIGWDAMYNSDGSINPFSSVTQEILRYQGPAYQNLPEGGFVLGTWAKARVKIGDTIINMPAITNNNYMFIVRGKYGDSKQNTDRNITMEISEYFAGHAQVLQYPPRDNTNAAFISQGQFEQIAKASHSKSNNGDGGASKLTVVMYDSNSGAFSLIQQDKDRFADTKYGWKHVFSNFSARPIK